MRLAPLLLLGTLLGACRAEDVPAPAEDPDPRFNALLAWTNTQMAAWHVPGVALAVVEDGRLQHLAGLGVRRYGEPELVDPDTLFRVASLSKMFTGALAAEQAAEGALDVNAPASTTLGDLTLVPPHTFADFTYLQLLSHQSGMQTTGLPNACDTDPDDLAVTLAGLTPEWALWTDPGVLYDYSNQGYSLVGLALERTTGQRFPDMAQALFDAAGMSTATYDWEVADAADHATGHTIDRATGEPDSFRAFDERACVASFPSGGLMASARDMGHAAEVLLAGGDGWMSPAAWEIMTTQGWRRSETSGYGFGLQNTSYAGFPSLVHHGSLGGYYAMLWVVPSEGLGIVVLVNASVILEDPPVPWDRPTERIMRHALDLFLGVDDEAVVSTVRPVDEWARFAGAYHSDYELGDVTVTFDGAGLRYTAPAEDIDVPLVPYSSNSFEYLIPGTADSYGGVSFVDGDTDTVEWLVTDTGVAVVQAR